MKCLSKNVHVVRITWYFGLKKYQIKVINLNSKKKKLLKTHIHTVKTGKPMKITGLTICIDTEKLYQKYKNIEFRIAFEYIRRGNNLQIFWCLREVQG